jgi:hypothetical protein
VAVVTLERAMNPPAPYARDGRSQAVAVFGTSGTSPPTYQTTSSTPSGPAAYPPIFSPFSSVSPRAASTPQPAVRTISPRSHPRRRYRALVHAPTAPHFCRETRTSPARWQHSALSRTVFALASGTLVPNPKIPAPAPGTAAQAANSTPEATPAGTTAAMELGRKIVLKSTPTASRGNQRSRHHRRHKSTLRQAAFSLRVYLVNASSWSTRVPTSASTPAGSSREAGNGSATTSVQLTALPSTPMDGCRSASTSVYAEISRGGAW